MVDALSILGDVVPEIVPFFGALAISSIVILISSALNKESKVLLQAACFSAGACFAVTYLTSAAGESGQLQSAWGEFKALGGQAKFCLSLLVVALVYFGGAMYIASPDMIGEGDASSSSAASATQMPASCDNQIGFVVPDTLPADDKEFFQQRFYVICEELLENLQTTYELPTEGFEWIKRMMAYTVDGGKMNRGLATLSARKTLAEAKGRSLTNKERCQAAALGWCIEFLQAFFLVADDVMDDSVTRRGQPCWFRRGEVKLIAINDSFILESFVYKILKRYFGDEPYYAQLVDLFLETTRQTEFGQLLDLTSQVQGEALDLNRYTIERYFSIVRYKTAFYSFYAPVALGMIAAGVTERKLFEQARKILLIMGEYFQVQDDYLDCYGSPEVIGKIGTDIQDSKCSWLVVQALDRANAKQRKLLEDNYGQSDMKKVNKVKKLYEELDLEQVYFDYEEQSYRQIRQLMAEVDGLPMELFEFLLMKIYKRAK